MAALQGSVAVLQQLMKFDQSVVTSSRNRTSDSTPLHMAAEGGHAEVIKMLLDAGANPLDENKVSISNDPAGNHSSTHSFIHNFRRALQPSNWRPNMAINPS